MSDSRLAAFIEICAVMVACCRLLGGLARSTTPMLNCVTLATAPSGIQDVRAIELVQITVRMKISGSDTSDSSHGTPKNSCVAHAPTRLKTGTPIQDTHNGTSMCCSTSLRGSAVAPAILRIDLNALTNSSGLAARLAKAPTTIIDTPHQIDHWLTISGREICTTCPLASVRA